MSVHRVRGGELGNKAPYRGSEIKPLCDVCGEFAPEQCLRCGRPYCADHALAEDLRCGPCEELFRRRDRRRVLGVTLLAQITLAPSFLIFGWPSPDSGRWQERVRRWGRRRFLRERLRTGVSE